MIKELITNRLQEELDKKQQELIRLKWERLKWKSAVKKLKEIDAKKVAAQKVEDCTSEIKDGI